MTSPSHQAHPRFSIDIDRWFLVHPDAVALCSLESAAALLIGFERELRPAAKPIPDLGGIDEIGDAALPRDVADILGRDQAGSVNVLGAAFVFDGPEQLLLDDVARGLVLLARRPPIVRPFYPVTIPPGW